MLGIRPENFALGEGNDGIGIDVAVVEELGADAFLYGTVAGLPEDEQLTAKQITARISSRTPPQRGSTVRLKIDPDHVHVFSRDDRRPALRPTRCADPLTVLLASYGPPQRAGGSICLRFAPVGSAAPACAGSRDTACRRCGPAADCVDLTRMVAVPRFLSAQPDTRLITLPWAPRWRTGRRRSWSRCPAASPGTWSASSGSASEVYALKEVLEHLALHEYRLLRDLTRLDTPSVEAGRAW